MGREEKEKGGKSRAHEDNQLHTTLHASDARGEAKKDPRHSRAARADAVVHIQPTTNLHSCVCVAKGKEKEKERGRKYEDDDEDDVTLGLAYRFIRPDNEC